ncbi:MAG: bifunctional demethylmenaquinone methyltransferase/2-methoxy-6-polyprenyl-1,4-benzoquinol methylase UbiE [Kiritimatiellae bacterium]|jgi:demethylmenaquinone methyltransferase/2-methoxy-6-polyprenyl-1,4-benzoquinol methylase|nr:bifunctional demethylmenaquinone methyltransferase/2-methoxy-6-polyprenyl-1,4-benzoquinol methylase UbiE [Kiritimatiellia bacterium]
MNNVENINPYNSNERKSVQIENTFDKIAARYDFMNRILSMGIDVSWRRRSLRSLQKSSPMQILDVATGTGDLSIMEAKEFPCAKVTGIDLSEGMLAIAKSKAEQKASTNPIDFIQGDCLKMPFIDNSFDLATIAFGIRNFEDLEAGCREIRRVLRPGCTLLIIELSRPTNKLLAGFYSFYLNRVIPVLGKLLTGRSSEYKYLPESIKHVPQGAEMLNILTHAGFTSCKSKSYTFGSCSCYTAVASEE